MESRLLDEALVLCRRLYLAQLAEEGRRDFYGNPAGDLRRIERLEALRRKAADRWRRRAGFAELAATLREVRS